MPNEASRSAAPIRAVVNEAPVVPICDSSKALACAQADAERVSGFKPSITAVRSLSSGSSEAETLEFPVVA